MAIAVVFKQTKRQESEVVLPKELWITKPCNLLAPGVIHRQNIKIKILLEKNRYRGRGQGRGRKQNQRGADVN